MLLEIGAVADFSIKQRLVITPIWQLPFGKGQHYLNQGGLSNTLAGGWEVSGIVAFQSGFPYTVLSNIDFSNTNSFFPRPDRTCNGAGPQTVAEWFNVNCFNTDALSQALGSSTPRFGNSGRNILTGPSIQQWDVSLIKRNPLTEKLNLEFRAEFLTCSTIQTSAFLVRPSIRKALESLPALPARVTYNLVLN